MSYSKAGLVHSYTPRTFPAVLYPSQSRFHLLSPNRIHVPPSPTTAVDGGRSGSREGSALEKSARKKSLRRFETSLPGRRAHETTVVRSAGRKIAKNKPSRRARVDNRKIRFPLSAIYPARRDKTSARTIHDRERIISNTTYKRYARNTPPPLPPSHVRECEPLATPLSSASSSCGPAQTGGNLKNSTRPNRPENSRPSPSSAARGRRAPDAYFRSSRAHARASCTNARRRPHVPAYVRPPYILEPSGGDHARVARRPRAARRVRCVRTRVSKVLFFILFSPLDTGPSFPASRGRRRARRPSRRVPSVRAHRRSKRYTARPVRTVFFDVWSRRYREFTRTPPRSRVLFVPRRSGGRRVVGT